MPMRRVASTPIKVRWRSSDAAGVMPEEATHADHARHARLWDEHKLSAASAVTFPAAVAHSGTAAVAHSGTAAVAHSGTAAIAHSGTATWRESKPRTQSLRLQPSSTAARRAGVRSIPCEVRPGTLRDSKLYACGANATHGLPRSSEDVRNVLWTMFDDAEWSRCSDREISRRAKLAHSIVGRYSGGTRERRGARKRRAPRAGWRRPRPPGRLQHDSQRW
jgi:hypothetical protein